MNPVTIFAWLVAGLTVCCLSGFAHAEPNTRWEPGKHFRELELGPAITASWGRESLEFFTYYCPHCLRAAEIRLSAPSAVPATRRMPAAFNATGVAQSRMFYALGKLKAEARLPDIHLRIMRAVQQDKKRLTSRDEQAAFLSTMGIDAQEYIAAFESDEVANAEYGARSIIYWLNLQSTPALVVGNRFYTSASMAGGVDAMYRVASYIEAQLKSGNVLALKSTSSPAQAASSTARPAPVPPPSTAAQAKPAATTVSGNIGYAVTGGTWPVGMEPGNLYFISVDHADFEPAIMVAARTGAEALARVQLGFEAERDKKIKTHANVPVGRFSIMANGECVGPAWGATVSNHRETGARRFVWGGGCGRSPPEAIRAAFKACKERNSEGCDLPWGSGWKGPSIILALSGSTSWNGRYCPIWSSCAPPTQTGFGSFNAWTHWYSRGRSYVNNMEDSINKLGRECDAGSDPSRPCFLVSTKLKCYFDSPIAEVGKRCTDPLLTRNGYSGPLRISP